MHLPANQHVISTFVTLGPLDASCSAQRAFLACHTQVHMCTCRKAEVQLHQTILPPRQTNDKIMETNGEAGGKKWGNKSGINEEGQNMAKVESV